MHKTVDRLRGATINTQLTIQDYKENEHIFSLIFLFSSRWIGVDHLVVDIDWSNQREHLFMKTLLL